MKLLGVSGAVGPIYGSLGVKGLTTKRSSVCHMSVAACMARAFRHPGHHHSVLPVHSLNPTCGQWLPHAEIQAIAWFSLQGNNVEKKMGFLEAMIALMYHKHTAEWDQNLRSRTGPEVISSTNPPKTSLYFWISYKSSACFFLLPK